MMNFAVQTVNTVAGWPSDHNCDALLYRVNTYFNALWVQRVIRRAGPNFKLDAFSISALLLFS